MTQLTQLTQFVGFCLAFRFATLLSSHARLQSDPREVADTTYIHILPPPSLLDFPRLQQLSTDCTLLVSPFPTVASPPQVPCSTEYLVRKGVQHPPGLPALHITTAIRRSAYWVLVG